MIYWEIGTISSFEMLHTNSVLISHFICYRTDVMRMGNNIQAERSLGSNKNIANIVKAETVEKSKSMIERLTKVRECQGANIVVNYFIIWKNVLIKYVSLA